MQFVNIHGQPIVGISSASTPAKKSSRAQADSFHKGWRVVGFSPEQLAEAKLDHEKSIAAARAAGNEPPKPWDEALYMRQAKPRKVRSKPYEIHEAALECKALAERGGWKGVIAVPVAKGGKE